MSKLTAFNRLSASLLLSTATAALVVTPSPATAQTVTPGANTNAGTVVNGVVLTGAGPTFGGATSNTAAIPNTSTITLNSNRTILNWGGFNLTAEDTLQFQFAANTDVALNRVGGSATINGQLYGCLGVCNALGAGGAPTNFGGNIWLLSSDGIMIGSTARVNAGGLLFGTGATTDSDFFNSNFNFLDAQNRIDVHNGARLTASNGALTLMAPVISFAGNALSSGSIALIGAKDVQIAFDGDMDAYLAVTVNEGSDNNGEDTLQVGSSASFNTAAVASGGRTLLIAASNGTGLGSVVLGGIAADRVEFVEGDVVLYSAGNVTAPRSVVAGGLVQGLGAATGTGDVTIGAANVSAGNLNTIAIDDVTVNDAVAVSGNARFEAGGDLTVNTAVSAGGDYTIRADDFYGAAAFNPNEGADINIEDTAAGLTIGGIAATDDLRITAENGQLTIAGGAVTANGGSIFLTTTGANAGAGHNLVLQSNVTDTGANGIVTLTSTGAISQSGGVITAGLLSGSTGEGSVANLSQSNAVASIGNFTANGFNFTNAGALNITGAVDGGAGGLTILAGGAIALTSAGMISTDTAVSDGAINLTALGGASDIVLAGRVVAGGGTFSANAGAMINQTGGSVIVAGQLTGGAGGQASFNGIGNRVANLGNFDSGTAGPGGFLLTNSGSLSTLAGTTVTTNDNPLELRLMGAGADLTLAGTLDAGSSTVALNLFGPNGDISQTAGAIVAAALSGQSGGATSLTRSGIAGNSIINLDFFQAGGGFTFAQDFNLNIVNTVNGVNGPVNVTSVFGDIIVAAPNGFVTSTGVTTLDAGDALTVNGRVAGGTGVNLIADSALTIGAGTFRVQTVGGTIQLSNGDFGADIDVNGGVEAGTGSIDIDSANGSVLIAATGSLNAADTIEVDAGGLLTVGGAVLADTVVDLQSAGALSITGVGQVGSAGLVRLASTGNAIAIGGAGAAALGTLDLDSFGGVTQASAISAGTLTGTNGGAVTLTNAGNAIGALSSFSATNLTLRDSGDLLIAGAVNIGSGTFGLTSAGSVDQQASSVITAGTFTGSASGAVDLFDGVNQIQNLGSFTNSGTMFRLRNGADLNVVGSLTNTGGDVSITTSGALVVNDQINSAAYNVSARATGGDITIGAAGSVVGSDVVLSTDQSFINNSGSDALSASNRWLVYSSAPDTNTYGGLDSGNTAIWNATYGSVDPSTISGNRYVFAYQPTLTFASADANKTYGTLLTTSGYAVSGFHSGVADAFVGDTAATAFSGAPVLNSAGFAADATVAGGPYAIGIATGTVSSTSGYALAFDGSGLLTIDPKALNGTVTANDKTYDGTTDATGSITLSGVLFGDEVTASALLAFADKNAGSDKTVLISGGSLSGADASNYTVSLPASVLADIFRKAITGSVVADDKTYDGNSDATGTITLSGLITGDEVTASAILAFADANAGNDKVVTVSGGSLSGADSGNYSLSLPASVLADIFRKAITGTVIADDKTYDGTTDANGSVTLDGVIAGDVVTASAILAFADANAGSDRTVLVSGGALAGADAGNYSLTLPASVLADIFRKAISGTVVADDKTYDGTTGASGSISLDGVIAGDDVMASAILAFADANAGSDKTVTVSGGALSGADSGNYALTLPASVVADIFKKALTGTVVANDKTYDGTTGATGSVSLSGLVAGDEVTASALLAFANKNAGSDKIVLVSGGSLSGADAGNYTLSLPASVLADIFKLAITGTIVANDKTYDGTTSATGAVSLSGVLAGDSVTAGAILAFADANAGSDKAVTISGASLAGADAGNYTLTVPASTLADIFRAALTVTADSLAKGQGTPDPALTYEITSGQLFGTDTLSGAPNRVAGELPGDYAIGQGTLSASSNYDLTFVSGTFTVEPQIAFSDDFRSLLDWRDGFDPGSDGPLLIVDERDCDEDSNSMEQCGTGGSD